MLWAYVEPLLGTIVINFHRNKGMVGTSATLADWAEGKGQSSGWTLCNMVTTGLL